MLLTRKNIIVLIIALIIVISKTSISQTENKYIVSKKLYTYTDGLPGREVTCAVQDKNGYIWFGTKNGLCRFNGQSFQLFTKKSNGLYLNHIKEIFSDNNHGIIINYDSKMNRFVDTINHLDVIDINTLEIKSFDNYYKNCPFKLQKIRQIVYSEKTESLLFNLNPFFHLNIKSFVNQTTWELLKSGNFKKRSIKIIKTIKFKLFNKKEIPEVEDYKVSKDVTDKSLLVFNDGSFGFNGLHWIWLKYSDKYGYIVQHIDSLLNQHYYWFKRTGDFTSIGDNFGKYRNIVFLDDSKYYQAVSDSFVFSLNKNNVLKLHHPSFGSYTVIDSTDDELLKKSRILNVLIDKLGNRWLCTTEGVIKVTLKKQKFNNYFTSKEIPLKKNHSARGILVFNDTLIASLYDFIAIQKNNGFESLNFGANFSLLKSNHIIWLGSYHLRTYNENTKKVEYKNQFKTAEIWSLFQFNKNQLLLGGTENIHLYDIITNTAKILKNNTGITPQLVYRFFYNSKKQLMAVANNGVFIINPKAEIIDCYSETAKLKNRKLPFANINDLYEDRDGIYWFATANDGVYRFNPNDYSFEQIGIDNGFLTQTIYKIEEDRFRKLWISTDFGLAKFDKETRKAQIYSEADGIAHNEFNRSSSFKDNNGNLYFGGIDGITSFNPIDFEGNEVEHDYPFLVNHISRYNSQTNILEDETNIFNVERKLELTDDRRNITLSVILLDLEERAHLYAYQLEGISKEWNYMRDGIISISTLPYGKYTIRVKAQCANGSWNKTEIIIPLVVMKPFYKTWWFITCAMFSVVFLSIIFVKYRIKKLQIRNIKLETEVEIRTTELKSSLSEQIALLQEVHHRVKNNLQVITAMLKMQINSIKDEGNQKVLIETSRRINSMSLVHEMLYNKNKLETISVKEYLTELVSKLNEVIHDKQMPIHFALDIEDVKFDINDCVSIGMITSEVISNAIKYAFCNTSHPTIKINLHYSSIDKIVIYTIEDNGIGFKKDSSEAGLGMRLIDIFSRQMEAEYEITNNKGLVYTFKIPFDKNEK